MVGSFRRMGQIGKGSFATVYKGVHYKKRELVVAIKSVDTTKLNKKLKDNLSTEIQILRNLTHPHIVALIDCKEVPKFIHIVTEFCELGDLSTFIKKRSTLADHPATAHMMKKYPNPAVGGLNEVLARHFLKQIASALEFIHAKNYVHRDLKPQNLLLNPSPLYYQTYRPEEVPYPAAADSMVPAVGVASLPMLKVADFGFARWLPKSSLAETLCGSPLYMAPEILRYEKYDAKADLWSTGTVLHEMLVGKPPFRASNHVELLRRIEKQDDRISFGEIPISRDMKNIKAEERAAREAKERVAQDIAFERDYVLVEKRSVEGTSNFDAACDQGLGITHGNHPRTDDDEDTLDEDLTIDAILTISEEALVLYVKALALLAKSIDLAGSWWGQRNRGEVIGDGASRSPGSANIAAIGTKMNQIVQWVRTRFNECVEKSEFVGRKLVEAQKQLPADHPAHPNNLPSNSTSTTSAGTSVENIHLPTGITAEKLMYDRAIEMSRAAAVNELVGEDLPGCELNYTTAIRMLEAIFEGEEEMLGRKSSKKQEEDVIQGLEDEDRASVLKLIESMRARLKALRKKIEMQRSQKRASLTAPGRGSPSSTPIAANASPR
ncbi:hypothetical protein GTA08_BOTSDO02711 [Neofusicoccum parvum]|uniref:non-specific serine/threonine protein kinase n=1 Tax=Botryosphaeria parva (strain UCR-NP2) TaxID=1287680 RepID=R1GH16_BOTPV|nr:putative serine threonine protein kinase protein [Neofusicoccum parvum UCRNP2]GME65029.1 hypothetical protein GTA08_BOTSDO02711 [Neofusicoccum parvum]